MVSILSWRKRNEKGGGGMTNEELYFKMQMLQAEIEMNGMIAENKIREALRHPISYDYGSFKSLIEKHGIHHNAFPFGGIK